MYDCITREQMTYWRRAMYLECQNLLQSIDFSSRIWVVLDPTHLPEDDRDRRAGDQRYGRPHCKVTRRHRHQELFHVPPQVYPVLAEEPKGYDIFAHPCDSSPPVMLRYPVL